MTIIPAKKLLFSMVVFVGCFFALPKTASAGLHTNYVELTVSTDVKEQTGYCTLEEHRHHSQIVINWTDDSTREEGYEIERNVNSGGFSSLTTTAENTTSYTDTDVSSGNTYQYRVRPYYSGSAIGDWCTTATLSLQTGSLFFD